MGKKVKAPVTRGAAKVPVIMQMEALECGAASLAMVMAYYGKWVPLAQLRLDCGVSRNGSNAKNILLAARSYGFTAKGYRLETEDLKKAGRFPCIIHWDFNHFVVLDGFQGGKAILNDPSQGICKVEMETFNSSFPGICQMNEPDEDFVPDGKPKSVLAFGRKRLKGAGPSVAFVVLCTLISALIGIIRPGFSRVVLDRLLTGINQEWLWPFLMGLTAFSCVEILFAGVREIYADRIDGKMAAAGNTAFMWKLLHLPMEFFSQRLAGDLQGRQNTNGEGANQLVHTIAPLALNAAMMVFYLVVMLRYNLPLTLIGVASVAVNVGFSRYISARRVNIDREQCGYDRNHQGQRCGERFFSAMVGISGQRQPPAGPVRKAEFVSGNAALPALGAVQHGGSDAWGLVCHAGVLHGGHNHGVSGVPDGLLGTGEGTDLRRADRAGNACLHGAHRRCDAVSRACVLGKCQVGDGI